MQAGRKQEPAPHLGYYHSGRTFLIAEDVKEVEEGEKKGREQRGRWNISKVTSCVIVPKSLAGSERERQGWWTESAGGLWSSAVLSASVRASGFI